MRRIVSKIVTVVLSAGIVVPMFDCFDLGASDHISLQCMENTFTAADLHQTEGVSYITEPASFREVTYTDRSSEVIEDNTFTIIPAADEEAIDPALFTDDGSSLYIFVEHANIRMMPNTESDILTLLDRGDEVLRISYGSDWSYIRTADGEEGYVLTDLLTEEYEEPEEEAEPAEETPAPTTAPTAVPTEVPAETPAPTEAPAPVIGESEHSGTYYATCILNVRTGPGTDNAMVRLLNPGDSVDVVAVTDNGWYRTSDGYYVKADLMTDTAPAEEPAAEPVNEGSQIEEQTSGEPADTGASEEAPADNGYSDFANFCLQYVGVPYQFGCSSPSAFDCSGFVMYVYANYYGIPLPHSAAEIATMGSTVSADGIACGDVMCHDYNGDGIIDHVSIYIGNGTCIHASDSRRGVITSAYPMGSVVTIRRFV